MQSATPPLPFGWERLVGMPVEDVVASLGVPHLSRTAFWWLVWIGPSATPAVRAGLGDENARVRKSCCELLEHWPDPDALPELEARLSDPDADVRRAASHTLTCDHCRDGTWATKRLRASVLPSIRLSGTHGKPNADQLVKKVGALRTGGVAKNGFTISSIS